MDRASAVEAIRASVRERRDEMVDLLSRALQQPTISGDERLLEPLFTEWFAERGWPLERQVMSETEIGRTPRGLAEPRMDERANLTGWYGAPRGRELVTVNAHYDVVPIIDPEDWTVEPFGGLRRDGAVFGRGAVDNKGGCVAALYALQALHDAGVELDVDVAVELISGEETTGLGTAASLEIRPDRLATIVMEPTENAVVPANSGVLFFTIQVTGKAVHTSVPWRGADALHKLTRIYDALQELGSRRAAEQRHPLMERWPTSVPLVIGQLSGGSWRAAVPAHATMSGRIGVLPGEDLEDVRQALLAAVAEVTEADEWLRENPPTVRWDNDGLPGWELTQPNPLVEAMAAAQRTVRGTDAVYGITAGCDAGMVHRAGIPVVVFGPGDIARAHSADEHILETELLEATEILAIALLELATHDAGSTA